MAGYKGGWGEQYRVHSVLKHDDFWLIDGFTTLLPLDLLVCSKDLAVGRRSLAGLALVVASSPGEGVLLDGLGGDMGAGSLAAGGRPPEDGVAGVEVAVPVWGLRQSTVTTNGYPLMSRVNYLGPLSITL